MAFQSGFYQVFKALPGHLGDDAKSPRTALPQQMDIVQNLSIWAVVSRLWQEADHHQKLSPNGKKLSPKVESGNEPVCHDDIGDEKLIWRACEPFSAMAGDLAPSGYQLPQPASEQPRLSLTASARELPRSGSPGLLGSLS
jgi:hypothetical protein